MTEENTLNDPDSVQDDSAEDLDGELNTDSQDSVFSEASDDSAEDETSIEDETKSVGDELNSNDESDEDQTQADGKQDPVVMSDTEDNQNTAENEDRDASTLTDEELDAVADTAISVLQDILKYFDIGEITIDEYEGEEGELILDITGDDLAVLIGRHGKTLDSLQFIVSAITVRKIGFRFPVVVDVEGYKNRQRQKIESIAQSAASRAATQGRNVKLRPMTPYERRIVHMTLRDDSRVETTSEGEGSARHVVVIPH